MDMLHVLYVAEALLGRPFRAISAQVMGRAAGARVEDLAVCRFEADDAVALVNVGWGVGPSAGSALSGPDGRIEIGYDGGGTGPFAPLASVRLTPRDGDIVDLTPPLPTRGGPIDVRMADAFRILSSVSPRAAPRSRPPPTRSGPRRSARRLCLGGHRPDRRAAARRSGPGPSRRDRRPGRTAPRCRWGDRPPGPPGVPPPTAEEQTMELGLYSNSLAGLDRPAMLDVAAEIGATALEMATGGESAAPHLDRAALLESPDEQGRPPRRAGRSRAPTRGAELLGLAPPSATRSRAAGDRRGDVEARPAPRRPDRRHDVRLPGRRTVRVDRELAGLRLARRVLDLQRRGWEEMVGL